MLCGCILVCDSGVATGRFHDIRNAGEVAAADLVNDDDSAEWASELCRGWRAQAWSFQELRSSDEIGPTSSAGSSRIAKSSPPRGGVACSADSVPIGLGRGHGFRRTASNTSRVISQAPKIPRATVLPFRLSDSEAQLAAAPKYFPGDVLKTKAGIARNVAYRRLLERAARRDLAIHVSASCIFHFPLEPPSRGPEWFGILSASESTICGVFSKGTAL